MDNIFKSFQSLSIIVPVVSETKTLVETINIIFEVCSRNDLKEIIICPAHFASPECIKTAKELCEKHGDFPMSILMQNGTFEDVIKDLFNTVSGSHFIFQPADLEEDPRMLPVYIEESKKHPDAIITGSRFLLKKNIKTFSKAKKIFYTFFHILFSIVYSYKLTDTTYLIWMIPTRKVKKLILNGKSYSVMYEAFLKILRTGTEVIEIPVEFQKCADRKQKVKFFKDGFQYLMTLFRVRFTNVNDFYKNTNNNTDL